MSTYGRPIAGLLPQGSGNTYGRPIGAAFQRIVPPPSTGLQVWLKADAGVAVSGANVTSWADQSGNNNNLTTVGGVSPVLLSAAAGINGLPAIQFTNSAGANRTNNCYLDATINPSAWSGFTVIYVARTANSGASNSPTIDQTCSVFSLGNGSQSVYWNFSTGKGLSYSGGFAGATGSVILGTYSPVLNNSQVVYQAYQYDKANWTMSGGFSGTVADTSFPSASLTMFVGQANLAGGQCTDDVAEILVYDHKLSSTDLAAVHTYMQARYGVS